MTVEQAGATIRSIQCLRGIAALMVVLHHLQTQMTRVGLPEIGWSALPSGVDIFFVISGFIMWVTTAAKPERTAGAFYRDRITRIAPLYWLMTAALVAVLIIAPDASHTAVLDWRHLLKSVFFIPALHPVTRVYQPTLILGWTLNMEMFFYLVFALAIAFGGMNLRRRFGVAVTLLLALVASGYVLRIEGVAGFYTQDIVAEFVLGIMIGVLFIERRLKRSNWLWVGILAGFALLIVGVEAGSRLLGWGVPASLIVLGAVFVPQEEPAALQRLGDWSYSLYLSHPLTLAASEKLWSKAATGLSPWVFPIFALTSAVAASWIIHRMAEIPLTQMARQKLRQRPREGASCPSS